MKNKIQSVVANILPNEMLARQHHKMAEPGSTELLCCCLARQWPDCVCTAGRLNWNLIL
jgi:hypothetical protein